MKRQVPRNVLKLRRVHDERWEVRSTNPLQRPAVERTIATFRGPSAESEARAALPVLRRGYVR